MRGWRLVLGAVIIAGMLVLAACGSSSGGRPAAAPLPPAAGPGAGLAFLDANHGWALTGCSAAKSLVPGQAGCTLLATADGGGTWTAIASGLPASAHLQFLTARDGFATIAGGTCAHGLCPGYVLATTDGGRTWTTRYGGPVEIAGVDFSSTTVGWSIVTGGVDTSTDGGARWHQSVPFADAVSAACRMDFVRFSTPQLGLAGGGGTRGPCLVTTRDGGTRWQLVPAPGGAACRATVGDRSWVEVACGSARAVWRSTDGGSTWQRAWSGGPRPLFFLNGTTAWRGAQRTTDGGATWTSGQSLGSATLAFVSADTGWARAPGGRAIYTTGDGGARWTRQWP